MPTTVHVITRHTVQMLTEKVRENARSSIIVRLYDDDNNNVGVTIFKKYDDKEPPKPVGDFESKRFTAYIDIAGYAPYMDILRLERPVYLKIAWRQLGAIKHISHVSIDTKKEILGEFFDNPSAED